MPTGYTADIAKGITFPTFALQCARAFSALIGMRDEPKDAPIPDEFSPSTYNRDHAEKAERRLKELAAMTPAECEEQSSAEYDSLLEYHRKGLAEAQELLVKYQTMEREVEGWHPPTPDHEGLKKFMLEQIATSVEHDCSFDYHREALAELKRQTPHDWRTAQAMEAHRNLKYASTAWAEEQQRATSRSAWVRNLRDSLKA